MGRRGEIGNKDGREGSLFRLVRESGKEGGE
jgi:hypothetical protein